MGGVADALRTGRDFVFGTPSEQSSNPVVDPALLSPENINAVIQQIMAMSSGPSAGAPTVGPAATPGRVGPAANPASLPVGIEQSPFFQLFRSAMTDRFTPTAPENQLLSNIMDQTSAQFARRGLGTSPVAASNTAASIAPALVALRQQHIGNLGGALDRTLAGQQLGLTQRGQDIGTLLANLQAMVSQRGQDSDIATRNLDAGVTQRGQDLQSSLNTRANTLQALLQLLQFGRRNPVGTSGTGTGAVGPVGGLFNPINANLNLGGGGGAPSASGA